MITSVRRTAFGESKRLEVSQHCLDNGLTVVLVTDHSAPVVAYQTWLRVGSAYEDPQKTGLAHLFEHLMFNETENLPQGVFDRRLEELGAQSNAGTWLDWTYYHEVLPSESFPEVVALESERLAHLKVQKKQVETEREVVANERRYRVDNDVHGTMDELLNKLAYKVHSYRWPTIGWMEHILAFTVEDCQQFYKTYYAPNNATLIVVGDVDEKDTLELLEKSYGGLKSQRIPDPPKAVEPPQEEEIRSVITWPMGASRLLVGYHAVGLGHPDHVALTVANEVLFGGRSGRLRRILVDEMELVSDVSGWVPPLRWPGLYEISGALREGCSWEKVLDVLGDEIKNLANEGPTAKELQKSIARGERSFFDGLDSADGKAQQLGFFHTALDDFATLFNRVEQLEKVTKEDVQRVAQTYLLPKHRTVVAAEPGEGGQK